MDTNATTKSLTPFVRAQIIKAQRAEITEYHIYKLLAQKIKKESNKEVLSKIAEDEIRLSHLGSVYFDAQYRNITMVELTTLHYWQVVADDLIFRGI